MLNNNFKLDLTTCWQMCFVFCAVAAIAFMPDMAFAADTTTTDSGLSFVLCRIVNQLVGPIGKAVSMIAVIVLGIGLFVGKLSWALAIATGIGIGLIFSAGKIVVWLSGGKGADGEAITSACAST